VPLSLAEFTAPDKQAARGCLDRSVVSGSAPLDKGAVAKAHSTLAADFGDLIAWAPKRAVADANDSGIGLSDIEHCGIVAVK
jgi:hypothetical protein